MPEFDVLHRPAGRGLVRDGPRVFSVPEALARELTHAGDDAPRRWREMVGETRGRRAPSPLWLRVVLLPAPWADRAAGRLSPLAGGRALTVMAAVGALGLAAGVRGGALARPESAAAAALGTVLFALTALWHELGHAAALRRERLPAGTIGAGLLWVMPVLTCDVTASALLGRAGRTRVDAAGMVFQFAAAGALAAVASVWPPAGHGAAGALAAVLWNAVPLLRTDSHWFLLDVLGLPDLDAPAPPSWPRRGVRVAGLTAWRVVTVASLLALLAWLPYRADNWLARWGARALPGPAVTAVRVAGWLIAAAGGWRAWRRLRVLLRAVARDLA
jgi:hypothetical protein